MSLVITEYEPDNRNVFLELTRNWFQECPVCQYIFVIADSELKTNEISLVRIRHTYPDNP
jgi:hypothetical protein